MVPRNFRLRLIVLLIAVPFVAAAPAAAQHVTVEEESWLERFNPFRPFDPSQPITVPELCRRLDSIAERMRDDGLVALKQPDVFSQARLTRFRNDFDNQMSSDLGTFHLVLAARINRLDSATTTQSTALSAALAAPGTTSVPTPPLPDLSKFYSNATSLFPATGTTIDPTKSAFGNLGLAPNTPAASPASAAALGLGVDPTVYLDEKQRFLEHLNQIRRISLGPDQNDSSGYGLYLVRLPVSITPGEKTYHGFGAELALHVEHEFPPDFLPVTFQSLVINDLVDQLGPVIYEALRSGFYKGHLLPWHEARVRGKALKLRNQRLIDGVLNDFAGRVVDAALGVRVPGLYAIPNLHGAVDPDVDLADPLARPLKDFIIAPMERLNGDKNHDAPLLKLLGDRLTALAFAREAAQPKTVLTAFRAEIAKIRSGEELPAKLDEEVLLYLRTVVRDALGIPLGGIIRDEDVQTTLEAARNSLRIAKPRSARAPLNMELMRPFLTSLYESALPEDVEHLNVIVGVKGASQEKNVAELAANNLEQFRLGPGVRQQGRTLNLPSVRTAKQLYPIAPRELLDYFLPENIYLLARDAMAASRTGEVRSSDIRSYLRHTLEAAYAAMTYPTQREKPDAGVVPILPLDDEAFMTDLLEAINEREYGLNPDGTPARLLTLYGKLVDRIEKNRTHVRDMPIAALCWAIAVDAGLLDRGLRGDARRVFAANNIPIDHIDNIRFYHTKFYHRYNPGDPAVPVFNDYVRTRWPIITFGLDPVSDQQNIADSFNLKRDLQLALSFAFATGQIGFNQMSTFRRQIEQSSDTIALNRTVTGFVHGNDNFGFRFTPRFQNPPNQRTNFGVIASQLIGGGPGPDYQMKKSKLEPGMRELTAVLLVPSFLTTMRVDVTSNWFRLNDPEHLVFHTNRMMEQGRLVQEIRRTVIHVCSSTQYREADRRVLQSKLAMLEAMLPSQSKVIQLPFENSASGFDLFSDGATALVPELTGYSGVDVIPVTTPAAAVAIPTSGTPGLQVQTSTTLPNTVTTTSVVGGTNSIADIFVTGKYFNLLDTRVIAGSRSAAFEVLSREVLHVQIPANVIPTTTEDGNTYIEIFLATPNGNSNSLLVPYRTTATVATAFDLAAPNPPVEVFYQWLPGVDGKPALVATTDPGKKGVTIAWDSPTSIGPRMLQVTFQGTVAGALVNFTLSADVGTSGDYSVNGQQFALALLSQLQNVTTAPALVTTPLTFTVKVQPWEPFDGQGVRVRTETKPLKSKLTVNMNYNANGQNALRGVTPVPQPPPPGQAAGGGAARLDPAGDVGSIAARTRDAALLRTAQSAPPSPSVLNLPQPPPPLDTRTLLSPNITSESEQVARMLTGQPFNPNIPVVPAPASAGGGPTQTTTTVSTATATAPGQPIVVLPAPVVVLPPKPDVKATPRRKSRFHPSRMLNRLGDRVNQALSPLPVP
jgi:hypothetical protein